MVDAEGIEPSIFRLSAECINRYATRPLSTLFHRNFRLEILLFPLLPQ